MSGDEKGDQRSFVPAESSADAAMHEKSLGNAAYSKGDYSEAIARYSSAIELDSSNHIFFGNRSMARLRIHDSKGALDDARASLELNPSWAKGHYRLGSALVQLNRFSDAIVALENAMKLSRNPEVIQMHSHATHCSMVEAALESIETSGDDGPTPPLDIADLARAVQANVRWMRTRDVGEALAALSVSLSCGSRKRCMQVMVIDRAGKLLSARPPNAMKDRAMVDKLNAGEASMINVFCTIDAISSAQRFAWTPWHRTSSPSPSSGPGMLSSSVGAMHDGLSSRQKVVLDATMGSVERLKVHNDRLDEIIVGKKG